MTDCRTCGALDCINVDDYDVYSLQQPSVIAAVQSGRITLSDIDVELCRGEEESFNVIATGESVDGYSEWTVIGGSLPSGLTLSSHGSYATISGTPTASGNYTFALLVESTNGDRGAKVYRVLITSCICSEYVFTGGSGSGFIQLPDPISGSPGDYVSITLTLSGAIGAFMEIDGGPFYASIESATSNTVTMDVVLGDDGGSGYYIGIAPYGLTGPFSGYTVNLEVCLP